MYCFKAFNSRLFVSWRSGERAGSILEEIWNAKLFRVRPSDQSAPLPALPLCSSFRLSLFLFRWRGTS